MLCVFAGGCAEGTFEPDAPPVTYVSHERGVEGDYPQILCGVVEDCDCMYCFAPEIESEEIIDMPTEESKPMLASYQRDLSHLSPERNLILRENYIAYKSHEWQQSQITVDDLLVFDHYGPFDNGYEVVVIYTKEHFESMNSMTTIDIIGYIIALGSYDDLLVHKDGIFVHYSEAIEQFLIELSDVRLFAGNAGAVSN